MADPTFDISVALKNRLPDSDHSLALLLIAIQRLARILELDLRQSARLSGLEKSEHDVVTTLWLAGPNHPLSPTQLSKEIIQTTSGMTKTLRRLEQARLVERVPDPSDGRRQLVRLTSAGSRLVERHDRQIFDRWKTKLASYSGPKRDRLANTLWSFLRLVEESSLAEQPARPHQRTTSTNSATRRAHRMAVIR
jgi:DNA-binding MarR family transcriptional regulator